MLFPLRNFPLRQRDCAGQRLERAVAKTAATNVSACSGLRRHTAQPCKRRSPANGARLHQSHGPVIAIAGALLPTFDGFLRESVDVDGLADLVLRLLPRQLAG